MGLRDASRQVGLPGGGHETLEDAARQLHLKRFCCVVRKGQIRSEWLSNHIELDTG